MPYISTEGRNKIARGGRPGCAGELNYVLTQAVLSYWNNSVKNYQAINDIVGALEGCKSEFQRRIVAKYEDQKLVANGDVYV